MTAVGGLDIVQGPNQVMDTMLLHHSWPLYERERHFELGHVFNCLITDIVEPPTVGALAPYHIGCWECDLADNSLSWSSGVFDIFGLPRGVPITRAEAVALYCEGSRAAMERLRAYSIKHRRGFTLDTQIKSVQGEVRWVRLIGAPLCKDEKVVRLHGLKLIL